MLDYLQSIDEALLKLINGWHSPFFDQLMWWASGKFTWWPFYLLLLVFIIWKKGWKHFALILFSLIFLISLSDQSSVHLFKNVFERLRPSHNPGLHSLLHYVNGYHGGKYGFISSHASNTFAVAWFLILIFRKNWLTTILIVWAVFVSYSRIYLGVHYPFDVIAGAAWGALLGFGTFKLIYMPVKRRIVEHNTNTGYSDWG